MRGCESKAGAWVKPSIDTLVNLATALDTPVHELLYIPIPDAPGAEQLEELKAATIMTDPSVVRILMQVAGWVGTRPQHSSTVQERVVVIDAAFARGRQLKAFRICGDSMDAGTSPIHDGDLILVDTTDMGVNASNVVAQLVDGNVVCKVLKDDRCGRPLQSRNVDHTNGTPSAIPMDEVKQIIGRVVRIIQDV